MSLSLRLPCSHCGRLMSCWLAWRGGTSWPAILLPATRGPFGRLVVQPQASLIFCPTPSKLVSVLQFYNLFLFSKCETVKTAFCSFVRFQAQSGKRLHLRANFLDALTTFFVCFPPNLLSLNCWILKLPPTPAPPSPGSLSKSTSAPPEGISWPKLDHRGPPG